MLTVLARARQQRKKTKESIINALGWTQGLTEPDHPSVIAYRHLELGHCTADPELRARLAAYFDIPEDELFTDDGYAKEPEAQHA